jgi:excisionase family DNA binding protein
MLRTDEYRPQRLVNVAEVAERLSVSVPTTRRLIASGVLPAVRIGHSVRIDAAASQYDLGRYAILQAIQLGDLRLLRGHGKSVIARDSLEGWLAGVFTGPVAARRERVEQARRRSLAELKRHARRATRAAKAELRRQEAELRRQAIEEARQRLGLGRLPPRLVP